MRTFAVHLNGRTPTVSDLSATAFADYGHFTSMQVRAGRVRGLDIHLDRLRSASVHLFGTALPDEQVRAYLRKALSAGPGDVSLNATVYSTDREFTVGSGDATLEMLVRTGPAVSGPTTSLALDVVEHERTLAEVKHVGEFEKAWFLRQAAARGFDDAAFVDRQGRISEATIWNLAFWDGHSVIWPAADHLRGATMQILRRQLERRGVPQRTDRVTVADIARTSGAVVMNSWTPAVEVRQIGNQPLPSAGDLAQLLHDAYRDEVPVAP